MSEAAHLAIKYVGGGLLSTSLSPAMYKQVGREGD